jgi:hypothetical protein
VNGAFSARFKSGQSEMPFKKEDKRSWFINSCPIQMVEHISDRCKVRVDIHSLRSGWKISVLDGSRDR